MFVIFAIARRHLVQAWSISLFGHVADSTQMFLHTKPHGCRRTSPLVGSPTSDGDGHLVDHEGLGAARSGLMSECHFVTTGTPVSTVTTAE